MGLTTRAVGVAVLLAGLAACAVGPNYKRPETTPTPPAWRDSAQAGRDSSFANVPWWGVFNDDTLQTLIRHALKENRDVHIALARVNEARALLGPDLWELLRPDRPAPDDRTAAGISLVAVERMVDDLERLAWS